jgi:hypothetical protein
MRRRLMLAVALLAGMLAMSGPGRAVAGPPFSNASLLGSYGFRYAKLGHCDDVHAAVGVLTFDGAGNFSMTATMYQSNQEQTGVPSVSDLSVQGPYTVNPDGTGSIGERLRFVIDSGGAQLELLDVGLNSIFCAAFGVATRQ